MSTGPTVSVIIPTHDRVRSLMRTLRAFDEQTVAPEKMEIIVVADGCSDATEQTFDSHRSRCGSRLLVQDGLGAAAARNLGAEAAEGSILLFMDDDVEPLTDLVEVHLRAHARHPGRVVMGPYPYSLRGRSSFYHMHTRSWWQSHFAEVAQAGHRFHYRDLVSGNLSLSADLFRDLGGFNPAIRAAGGEDYEFGARVIKAGMEIAFEPEARALHHQHETMDLVGSLRRAKQEGHVNVVIGRLHPEVRAELFSAFEEAREPYFRGVRYLVFRRRWLGRALAWLIVRMLPVLEAAKMRRRWRKAVGAAHGYWYWRGVAEELGSEAALTAYLNEVSELQIPPQEALEVDLVDGLEAAEGRLDEERPASVCVRFGDVELGRIEPLTLGEPLRGAHLRPILAERLAFQMLIALAMRDTALVEAPPLHPPETGTWQ